MIVRALAALLLAPGLALAAPATAPAPAAPEVARAVEKMQAFYERTKGFDTRFEQRFQAGAGSRLGGGVAAGRMRFQKPTGDAGPRMRWDYDDGRVLLLVGDTSWTYDPDTRQATEYRVDPAQLSAAVTFLWGKGRLADEFEIRRATRTDLGEGLPLELSPRKPTSAFQRVFLVIDPDTGLVRQSVVVQPNGAENRLRFLAPKTDVTLEPQAFDPAQAFPAGTTRTRAAVPGQR